MYSYTMNAIAVCLTITSFIFLILSIRWRNIQLCTFTSLYVLTTSDILSDFILAIILFINQFYVTSYNQPDDENVTEKNYKNIYEGGFRMTPMINNCESVLLHYAMFLVPLSNTFISLFCKLLHCNYYMKCIGTKCDELMLEVFNSVELKQPNSAFPPSKLKKHIYIVTILSVISQWVMPPILIANLYIAGHNQYDLPLESYDSIACDYMMSPPLINCNYEKNDYIGIEFNDDDVNHLNNSSLNEKYDYTVNYESTESSIVATEEIISKIHEIVQSAENMSELMMSKSSIYCVSQLANMWNIEPRNSTYRAPVKLKENGNSSIEDPLYTYINSIYMNMNVENELYGYKNRSEPRYIIPVRTENWCFISPNILKLHLFFSLFIVYFGTIFLSIISYMKCQYVYSSVIEKLETTNLITVMTSIENSTAVSVLNKNLNIDDCVEGKNRGCKSDDRPTNSKDGQFQYIGGQADTMKKLVLTLRTTILLAVLLWTPSLLHILAQVRFCYQIPNWLDDASYFMAVSFVVIRNISNIQIIKGRIFTSWTWMKHNQIRPIPSLSA